VERVREVVDENAGHVVETLLINGRMRAEDVVAAVWEVVKKGMDVDAVDQNEDKKIDSPPLAAAADDSNDDEPSMEEIEAFFSNEQADKSLSNCSKDSVNQQVLKDIVASLKKLTEAGYIEAIKPIVTSQEMQDLQCKKKEMDGDVEGGEFEIDIDEHGTIVDKAKRKRSKSIDGGKPSKKSKVETKESENSSDANDFGGPQCKPDDPAIVALLEPLRKLIPLGSVYRVNTGMCHASLKSMILGRLVQEFYAPQHYANVKSKSKDDNLLHVGGIVTAALTFAARQEHAPLEQILGLEESEEDKHRRMAEWGAFTPSEIAPYLPADATKALQSMIGGPLQNLSSMLIGMSELKYPPIVIQVEDAGGHPNGGKFEICTRQLMQRLRDRIIHRILTTRHGLVAARIVSILQVKGHMESDSIAEDAMVPAKEAREILHRLHRDKYVDLFDMHMTKTHNSGTAIYLWHVIDDRLLQAMVNDVQLAILHLRLRRQHEVEVGKDWMDRAKEAGATEENAHEEDQKRYHKFCKGLERLDCALLQLDETLMVLKDL
jgi:DNA-directed RNA polymerase III subunit RPC3